jgi:hypothetical protein
MCLVSHADGQCHRSRTDLFATLYKFFYKDCLAILSILKVLLELLDLLKLTVGLPRAGQQSGKTDLFLVPIRTISFTFG